MNFWTDPLMLAAGNARGLPGGDPDALDFSPTAGAVTGSGGPVAITDADFEGDLTANARRLGIPVSDLIALRRPRPRGWRRLFTRER